jgi:hypothetical protein
VNKVRARMVKRCPVTSALRCQFRSHCILGEWESYKGSTRPDPIWFQDLPRK